MASRAWNPWGDPFEWVKQMFALELFPKYLGFLADRFIFLVFLLL